VTSRGTLGVLTSTTREAPVSEAYAGKQIVGMDLHRRRSVLVRMTEAGERLETVRISNDPEYLRQVMARAGEAPEVVLEATYGGIGRRIRWPSWAQGCTWRTRWG
jgi:hypothetical protein